MDKVSVNLYGQVNRAMLWAGDGDSNNLFHVDNDNSSTRFGLNGKAANMLGDVSLGTKMEFEFQHNPSNAVNQTLAALAFAAMTARTALVVDLGPAGEQLIGFGRGRLLGILGCALEGEQQHDRGGGPDPDDPLGRGGGSAQSAHELPPA